MKTLVRTSLLISTSLLLFSCNSYVPYAYDDAYYTPGNDPVQQVKKNPREDFNKTNDISYDNSYSNRYNNGSNNQSTPPSYYSQNRYTEAEKADNDSSAQKSNQSNLSYSQPLQVEEEYYDPAYAQTVININSPVRTFNTYDPYVRDRILYTYDPFFINPTIYGAYSFWDPFVPRTIFSLGWNPWSGWNMGFGIGWGWNNWAWNAGYCPGFYDPFNPWSRWNAWNPYSGIGYGYSPYVNGYWNGYYHGFYDGAYSNGIVENVSVGGSRRYNTPRGNRGSISYNRTGTNTIRPSSNTGSKANSSLRSESQVSKSRSLRPDNKNAENRPNQLEQNQARTNTTPNKYRTEKTPNTYQRSETRPNNNAQPSNGTESRPTNGVEQQRATQNSRPNYSRPQRNNQYNETRPTQPRQQTRPATRPQQSARPSRNYNNTRPRYTPRPSVNPGRSSSGSSTPTRSPNRPTRR